MTTDYDTPELSEVIADALESRLLDVHVALPGRVLKYDVATQTVQIELGVHRMLETDEGAPVAEPLPVLENIPVAFPRVATGFLSFPVAAGDPGLVVFCETSIDQWRSKGTPTQPGDRRRHSLTGGVFVPGLAPNALALGDPGLASDVALGVVGGAQVRIKSATVEATSGGAATAADFVAMAGKVLTELQAIKTAFDSHTHVTTAVVGGGGAPGVISPPAVPMPAPNAVPSSNLKANN